jgi:hypothetical protein
MAYVKKAGKRRRGKTVPRGVYDVRIVKSILNHTKKEDGRYLMVCLKIMNGPYTGRRIWEIFNFENPNPYTEEMALQKLQCFLKALGLENQINKNLRNRLLKVAVKRKRKKDGRGMKNIIVGHFPKRSVPETEITK